MVNPNAEEIVLPSFTFVGDLVPVSAVSVALADPALPSGEMCEALPDHRHRVSHFFGGGWSTGASEPSPSV